MNKTQTIAAISTAMTESGIGIVRMCGEDAASIADKVFKGKTEQTVIEYNTHTIHYGHIMDEDEIIDQVLLMYMKGPGTFTGETTVEINCHGGMFVVRRILEVLIKYGARPAEPGEFTKRAFLNGKMDLSQAEAVIDLIQAKNEYALKSSISQLKGNIKKRISDIRNKIIYNTAFIETALDDPEHISIERYGEELAVVVEDIILEMNDLIESSDHGRIIKEGIKTVILGKPNAGKSSLLNAILGEERAIVTDIAGTTRDVLEANINLNGISLNIMDTAGIRDTEDIVEKIGVEKAKEYAAEADLIIYVIDASTLIDENDKEIISLIQKKKTIILLNKSDLYMKTTQEDVNKIIIEGNLAKCIEISAKNESGLKELEEMLKQLFYEGSITFNDEIYITNVRHKTALQDARESLKRVLESISQEMPEDFYSIDLIDAYESLGSITGETIGEDLVNEIFSKFCMGK